MRAISGVPIITGVKFQSLAHLCGKLEEGDEIVQVNYQTVVSRPPPPDWAPDVALQTSPDLH